MFYTILSDNKVICDMLYLSIRPPTILLNWYDGLPYVLFKGHIIIPIGYEIIYMSFLIMMLGQIHKGF